MSTKSIGEMTIQEIFDAVDDGMAEVSRCLASGDLDGSGRFFTDEELAAGAATGRLAKMSGAKSEGKAEDTAA